MYGVRKYAVSCEQKMNDELSINNSVGLRTGVIPYVETIHSVIEPESKSLPSLKMVSFLICETTAQCKVKE